MEILYGGVGVEKDGTPKWEKYGNSGNGDY
jgi:hypothetical protein